MFEQFNLQYVKRQEKRGLVDFDFERSSFRTTAYYLDAAYHGKSTIYISKIFSFNTIKYRNRTDFYSFFVKCLNAFTFWFNLPVIDFVELLLDAAYWRWTKERFRIARDWLFGLKRLNIWRILYRRTLRRQTPAIGRNK